MQMHIYIYIICIFLYWYLRVSIFFGWNIRRILDSLLLSLGLVGLLTDDSGWRWELSKETLSWRYIPYHPCIIFTYIWRIFMINIGKYTIHGCHGYIYHLHTRYFPKNGQMSPENGWFKCMDPIESYSLPILGDMLGFEGVKIYCILGRLCYLHRTYLPGPESSPASSTDFYSSRWRTCWNLETSESHSIVRPGTLNMEPENYVFGKENHLNQDLMTFGSTC